MENWVIALIVLIICAAIIAAIVLAIKKFRSSRQKMGGHDFGEDLFGGETGTFGGEPPAHEGPKMLGLPLRDPILYGVQQGKVTVIPMQGKPDDERSPLHKWKVGINANLYNSRRRFPIRVKAVKHYPSIDAMTSAEKLKDMGYSSAEDLKAALAGFGITDDTVKERGGIAAIHVDINTMNEAFGPSGDRPPRDQSEEPRQRRKAQAQGGLYDGFDD